jgi:hypothetical protein
MPLFVFDQMSAVPHLLTQLPSGTIQKQRKSETPGLIFLIFDMYKNLYNFAWRAVLGYFRALKSTENPKMTTTPTF